MQITAIRGFGRYDEMTMDIFEGGSRQIDGMPMPRFNKIKTITGIWDAHIKMLRRTGILGQAVHIARQAGHTVVPERAQVYLDFNPSYMPDGSPIPDDLAAYNGLLLAGTMRDAGRPLYYPIPVPIGLYFETEETEQDTMPTQLMAGALKKPGATLYPFDKDDGPMIHSLALEIDVVRNLYDLPLTPNLRPFDDTLQQLIYQRP